MVCPWASLLALKAALSWIDCVRMFQGDPSSTRACVYARVLVCVYVYTGISSLSQRILTNTIPPRPNARNRPPKPLLLPFLPSFSSASPTPTLRHICKVLLVASRQKMPPPHPPPPPMPPPPPSRQEPRGDQLAPLLCSLLWRTPSLDG